MKEKLQLWYLIKKTIFLTKITQGHRKIIEIKRITVQKLMVKFSYHHLHFLNPG